jgi:hypothetical protein
LKFSLTKFLINLRNSANQIVNSYIIGNKDWIRCCLISFIWVFFIVFLAFPILGLTFLVHIKNFCSALEQIKIEESHLTSILEKKGYLLIFIAVLDYVIVAMFDRRPKLMKENYRLILLCFGAFITQAINEQIPGVLPYLLLFLILYMVKYQTLGLSLRTGKIKKSALV